MKIAEKHAQCPAAPLHAIRPEGPSLETRLHQKCRQERWRDVAECLNAEALKVCSDWHVRPGGVPNDHTDVGYDWAVIDRLRALDARAGPVVRRFADADARFAGYRSALREARTRVEAGDREFLASPRCASYHTVWMQLHEELLVALGLERGQEA